MRVHVAGLSAVLAGWRLMPTNHAIRVNPASASRLIPTPRPFSSAHYTFRGRPRDVDSLPPPSTSTGYRKKSSSSDALALLDAGDRITELQGEVDDLRAHLKQMTEDHLATIQQLTAAEASLRLATARGDEHNDQERKMRARVLLSHGMAYSLSSPPATPTRARGLPPFSSPSKPRPLPATSTFLARHGLSEHLGMMQMATRVVLPTRWYLEVAGLGLDEDLASELLGCLEKDAL
ncbi:hypothetical protein B0H15DRAFT_807290 [Mycena belliarum]|uniref:Uncharacterized protein n=1 Tax=Mycena belliarum TaxID=1033014 RepID=A0AAD6XG38_9AGAR|nr:hypothetical protein B0H15DRAFT_807290 [Mycena belliae]